LALNNWNGYFALLILKLSATGLREPFKGGFEVGESLNVQSAHSTDKGKIANASMNIEAVKECQALAARETCLAKGGYQPGKLCRCEAGLSWDGHRPQVQQGGIRPAFQARAGQIPKGLPGSIKIKQLPSVEANELTASNDLQFYWHRRASIVIGIRLLNPNQEPSREA
jgi:hypothetical protein